MASGSRPTNAPATAPVLLFDGECGLCVALMRFLLKRSRRLHAAPLQGPTARELCRRAGLPAPATPQDFDSLVLIYDRQHPEAGHALRTDGVVALSRLLGPGWRAAGTALGWLPGGWRDAGYRVVARFRKKLWGSPRLPLPDARTGQPPAWAERLLP
ncbi:membrane protein [Opitutaceae bacterium TAV5]|nr:membrane protein [Opitutaceae bacterium TAV5]